MKRTTEFKFGLNQPLVLNFGFSFFSDEFDFKLGLIPRLKHHLMFRLNLGFKPVPGLKPRFQTFVLTKDSDPTYAFIMS